MALKPSRFYALPSRPGLALLCKVEISELKETSVPNLNLVKRFLTFCALVMILLPPQVKASQFFHDERIDIWPSIPFVSGADLCKYHDAYGQTRSEYMNAIVRNAEDLMYAGAYGPEALDMLVEFNRLYDQNQALATRGKGLAVTLESTLKTYIDQYYRKLRPSFKRLSFRHMGELLNLIQTASRGQRDGQLTRHQLEKLDFIAYGTYALAPNCRGDIQVTLHLVGKDGRSESYVGRGKPSVVMSQIASEIFTQFQRTQFPTTVRMGQSTLELIGGMNGSVDKAQSPHNAQRACRQLGGRLPNQSELEMLDARGDWSGGVSINDKTWAMPNGRVYAPYLRNPTPVRNPWEVNAKEFYYYCVR